MNNQLTDDEIAKLIEDVGECYLKHSDLGVRKLAEVFTNEYYPISKSTINKYLKIFIEVHPEYKKEVLHGINERTTKTINDHTIREMVLYEYAMLMNGATAGEIAQAFNKDDSSVIRDLNYRLKEISETCPQYYDYYDNAKKRLADNKSGVGKR